MRARGRALRQQWVIQAFDIARIQSDAQSKSGAKSLRGYLDELLAPAERMEKSSRAMKAHLDAMIARQSRAE